TLFVGDSSLGKSKVMESFVRFYKLGEIIDSSNATVAGLIGGNEQADGKKRFVKWGSFPRNDRKLVAIEELKKANPDVIQRLCYMRYSGVAQLPKIENKTAKARTRLTAFSNTRSGRSVSSYAFGVDILF